MKIRSQGTEEIRTGRIVGKGSDKPAKMLTGWRVVSRILIFICLLLVVFLGYRLMVVKRVDAVYTCVDEEMQLVNSVAEMVDSEEGLLLDEAQIVSESAESAGNELAGMEDCTATMSGSRTHTIARECSQVKAFGTSFVELVRFTAQMAAEGEDTYDNQEDIIELYDQYLEAVNSCDREIVEVLNSVSLGI